MIALSAFISFRLWQLCLLAKAEEVLEAAHKDLAIADRR